MNHITRFFPEALTHAIGWTLLHSLWQGAFVALLLSLLLVLLHRQSASLRYMVAAGAMLVQLLLSAGTLAYYYGHSLKAATPSKFFPATETAPAAELQAAQATFWSGPFEIARGYYEQHMPLLVTLWLLGMLVMALRFIGGLAYTQRLRHYKTYPLDARWQQHVYMLSQAMGMQKAVQLMESALVQVPMAIGFAKPVILLPIGAVTGLTQAQVEAVLAHELAHILRRDYLVNLLQSVVDMLFFYHPALWWVSGVVRAERENCCDDIAVALCGDTLTYARALAELEAMRLPAAPAMAVAFSGKRGTLMSRIRRLVGQPSLKPTFTEGFAAALALGLLVLSVGAVAGLKPQEAQDTARLAQEAISEDTTPVDKTATEANAAAAYTVQDSTGNNRDIVIIKNKRGKVKELYVDGKRIPNKDIDAYESLINQRLQAVNRAPRATSEEVSAEMRAARAAAADARRSNRETYTFRYGYSDGDGLTEPPLPPAPPAPPMTPPVPPVPPVPPAPPFNDDKAAQQRYEQERKVHEAEIKAFEKEMESYEKEIEQFNGELRAPGAMNGEQYREQAEAYRKQAERHREQVERQSGRSREMSRRQRELALQHRETAQKHEAQLEQVKAELVKDGIIRQSEDNLNIRINNGDFYVNGKKQAQEVSEKYIKLMNIEVSDSSRFNFQYNSN